MKREAAFRECVFEDPQGAGTEAVQRKQFCPVVFDDPLQCGDLMDASARVAARAVST